jgi:hypothetical protein
MAAVLTTDGSDWTMNHMTACPNSHHFDFINDNVVESKQKKKKKKE